MQGTNRIGEGGERACFVVFDPGSELRLLGGRENKEGDDHKGDGAKEKKMARNAPKAELCTTWCEMMSAPYQRHRSYGRTPESTKNLPVLVRSLVGDRIKDGACACLSKPVATFRHALL